MTTKSGIIISIMFVAITAGGWYFGRNSVKVRWYDRVITKMDTVVVEETRERDSLRLVLNEYREKLDYSHNLLARKIKQTNELERKVDTLLNADVYEWLKSYSTDSGDEH